MQEISLKSELSSLGQAIRFNALKNWEARVTEYLADLQAGADGLNNAVPQTDEERQEIFRLRKRTVNSLVERVIIDEKRELTIRIRLNLLDITDDGPESHAVHPGQYGTCTRTQSRLAHRRRCEFCG